MKRSNDTTPNMAVALIPLGALAVVAGCAGGGHSSPTPPQPPANTPDLTKHATTTAMLTIAIPARGPQVNSAVKRAPRYISQGSAAIGVSVGTTGQPAPVETVFPLPTPAPQATSTTLPVTAPIGNDTVAVNVYDAMPTPTTTPNVLSKGTTTATISQGSTQLAVQALGVAAGVKLASGGASTWTVFQNQSNPQTATVTATPIDADGYAITGNLASPVPLTAPAGVSLNPSTLTAPGQVTATYAGSQMSPGGTITAGLPLDAASGSTDNLTVAGTQYVFIATEAPGGGSGTMSAIDPVKVALVSSQALPGITDPYPMAAIAGCAAGEHVVVASLKASATVADVYYASTSTSAPTQSNPSTIHARAYTNGPASPNYFASDANCGLYSAADAALTRYSGFGSGITATPLSAPGWTANSSLAVQGSTLYGITVTNSGSAPPTSTGTLQSVPVSGGAVQTLGPVFSAAFTADFGMVVGGVNVYDLNTNCANAFLTKIPSLTSTSTPGSDFAVAPNGTVYLFSGSTTSPSAVRRAAFARYAAEHRVAASTTRQPLRAIGTPPPSPPPTVIISGAAGAVSADGRFLVVGASGATSSTAQVYAIPSTPGASPLPLGTPIPLGAQAVVRKMAFPH